MGRRERRAEERAARKQAKQAPQQVTQQDAQGDQSPSAAHQAAKQQAARQKLSQPERAQGKPNARRMVTKRRDTVELGGRKWTITALVLNDWQYLEDMAIRHYRREQVKTITENADLLREAGMDVDKMVSDRLSELGNVSIRDLPHKTAIMPVLNEDGTPLSVDENGLPGTFRQVMPYQHWFASNTTEGIALGLWLSLSKQHPELTLDEVEKMANDKTEEVLIQAAANRVGVISQSESAKNE